MSQPTTPFEMSLLPKGHQVQMAGDDWLSERDRKQQARAEAARKKAAQVCAKKLEAAAEALHDFVMACNECDDGSRSRGDDDGRAILQRNMREYAAWLDSVFNR